jgi:hypothetical protein
VLMTKTPEQMEAIIFEILELEKQRDALFNADTDESDKEAYTLDDKIVALIFDELSDDMWFERYLQRKSM